MTSSDKEQSDAGEMSVVEKVDASQLQYFATSIKTAEQQVGENIIQALQHTDTVAVLTTVVTGQGGQQVVSAALNPSVMTQVQELLAKAQQEREEEEPCVGFHCLLKPKADPKQSKEKEA